MNHLPTGCDFQGRKGRWGVKAGTVQLLGVIQNSHGFFQAPSRLAGQLSYSISSAGFGLASGLVGCERAQGKVAWCSPNFEGRFKHGKSMFIRLNQPIWQNNMLEMRIFHLNLGCEHQQTWFSPPRMLCKCHYCFLWSGVSASIVTIFRWKQLKGVNKLGPKFGRDPLFSTASVPRSKMCPSHWVELTNRQVSRTCVHTVTTIWRRSLQTFICPCFGGGMKSMTYSTFEFLGLDSWRGTQKAALFQPGSCIPSIWH